MVRRDDRDQHKQTCLFTRRELIQGVEGAEVEGEGPRGAGHLREVVVTLALGVTPWHPWASRATAAWHVHLAQDLGHW